MPRRATWTLLAAACRCRSCRRRPPPPPPSWLDLPATACH